MIWVLPIYFDSSKHWITRYIQSIINSIILHVVSSISRAWEAVEPTLGGCIHLLVRGPRPYRFGSDNYGCSRTNAWRFSTFSRRRLPAFLSKASTCASILSSGPPAVVSFLYKRALFQRRNHHSLPWVILCAYATGWEGWQGRAVHVEWCYPSLLADQIAYPWRWSRIFSRFIFMPAHS